MQYPEMIIFDYGHTLLYEPGFDPVKGSAALLAQAVKNPHHYTLADVRKASDMIYGTYLESVRQMDYEIAAQTANRTLYESLGIAFDLSPVELEMVFWDAASAGALMPEADQMLDYINQKGMRSAVISNLVWSGEALSRRLRRLLPRHSFEFIITSSDYFLRKPHALLFEIALQKAGLRADQVWYCGDNTRVDVEGAARAGLFPVWYDNGTDRKQPPGPAPQCAHLHIHEWSELIAQLERM